MPHRRATASFTYIFGRDEKHSRVFFFFLNYQTQIHCALPWEEEEVLSPKSQYLIEKSKVLL